MNYPKVQQLPDVPGNIRRLRQLMGLTQLELDAQAGLPTGTTAQYENGTRLPSLPHFWRLVAVFGVSPEHLVGNCEKLSRKSRRK